MKHYDDSGSYRGWDYTRPWYKFALKLLPKANNEKVLDLGAGNGEFSYILNRFNKNVFCVDYCRKYFKKLKKKGFKVYLHDFNKRLPFKDEYFDGVCCLEVIEHVVKAEQFLAEINRILKKNGWFIISTLNISWIGYRLLTLGGKVPFKEGYAQFKKVKKVKQKSIMKLAEQQGSSIGDYIFDTLTDSYQNPELIEELF